MLLQEMFPKVMWLNTAVSAVRTGVRLFSGVSHYMELESPSLSECFVTVIAGKLCFFMYCHVLVQVLLGVASVLTLGTLMTSHFDMADKFVPIVSGEGDKDFTTKFTRNFLRIVDSINMSPQTC